MTTFAGDFSPQAEAYALARPGYPAEMVDLLVDLADVTPGEAVAEIGAGTGLFTERLASYEVEITALEPNAAMRSKAPELDNVTWRDGTFESTGLEDSSQAWVVAAQAFHWADPERALPEMRRVLKPGRFFSVLWNNRDVEASPILTWTRELIHEIAPDFDEGYRRRDWWRILASTGHFETCYQVEVPHVVTMDKERYLNLWRSHNLLNATAGPERMADFLAKVEERLDAGESVAVPYICRVFTAIASA